MFLEVQECIMDVNDCSWMLMHGCQWAVFALTRWCGNEHGGHNWPRCLAAFANLGHLCTCRTSSLSPSQLCLKSSCSSWFSHRKPVMVCLNWRMPQVMIRCGRFGCWKRRFWTIGCWGCSFRENSCQRRLNGTRLLRVRVWLGLSGTFFLLRYSQNHVFVELLFHLEMPSSRNIISSTFLNLSRQEPTMSLVKTGLSEDLPDHEFCLFLSRNSCVIVLSLF